MPNRTILLVHLVDGGTRSFVDDGCTAEGEPNGRRQQLMVALAKMVPERDETGAIIKTEDGFAVEWPLFKLAAAPPKLAYDLTDSQERLCAQADSFDRKELRVDAGWRTPTPAWLEAAGRFRAARATQAREFEAMANKQLQNEAGKVLGELFAAAKAHPREQRRKGSEHGEGQGAAG